MLKYTIICRKIISPEKIDAIIQTAKDYDMIAAAHAPGSEAKRVFYHEGWQRISVGPVLALKDLFTWPSLAYFLN